MPLFRYFLVMGCCLIGLLFAVDYLSPKEAAPAAKVEAATVSGGGSLASWRQSQERLDKPQVAPVVYPVMAPLPPTAERLQWERQLTFRKADDPAPAAPALEARAETPATPAEAIAPPAPVKSALAKTPPRHKTVARVERRERHDRGYDRPNYASAYPPAPLPQFGYRQAQFDRPFGGGFFGRMF